MWKKYEFYSGNVQNQKSPYIYPSKCLAIFFYEVYSQTCEKNAKSNNSEKCKFFVNKLNSSAMAYV